LYSRFYIYFIILCVYLAVLKSPRNIKKKARWAKTYKNSIKNNNFSGFRKNQRVKLKFHHNMDRQQDSILLLDYFKTLS